MARNSSATNSQEVATTGGRQVTNVPEKNYFQQYGETAGRTSSIVGSLLKFNKGDWLLGQDEEEVDVGTRYVVSTDNILVGWVKWLDNKPVEQEMGKLSEGYQARRRSELGDTDQDNWELDAQGKPRDPWQYSNQLLMKPVGKQYSTDTAVTFVTSSKGGIGAVGKFCKAFGDELRTKGDQNPIVELDTDAYNHPNKEFGRIKTPVLKLAGWEKAALFNTDVPEEDSAASKKRNGKK